MSRFDYSDPGTDPRYTDDPSDADLVSCAICHGSFLVHSDDDETTVCDECKAVNPQLHDPPVDPAEHAMHSLIDALTTLEQQIVLAPSLERLSALLKLTKRAEQHATLVHNKCADAIDRAMERLR